MERSAEPVPSAGNLSLRQLEYLVTAVREGRLTRAAERLHVTEPTVSQQLRTLERAVGTPLLERRPEGVRPTEAGAAFLPYARTALCCADEATAAARAAALGRRRPLRVGTVRPALPGALLPGLRRWALDHPRSPVSVLPYGSRERLQDSVAAGTADVGVGPRPLDWDGRVLTLGVEELVVVCADDDELCGRDVHLEDLAGRRWIAHQGLGPGEAFTEAFRAAGFRPAVAAEVPQAEAAVALARDGVGLTLVAEDALPPADRRTAARPVPRLVRELTVYTAARPREEALACAATLAREARAEGPRTVPSSRSVLLAPVMD
ncbi:LysR family transcriptional regulator [Streptomyces sp. I05A-00742]|uniref:LysR family transcriptional regulator n=1 Tax=Streptomyces sp. I05A-00742 TaxID=2732853 RepID=UPI0014881F5E|nr:LysR family transcriptional regulator [Streptomyces sp. I05A-00742]